MVELLIITVLRGCRTEAHEDRSQRQFREALEPSEQTENGPRTNLGTADYDAMPAELSHPGPAPQGRTGSSKMVQALHPCRAWYQYYRRRNRRLSHPDRWRSAGCPGLHQSNHSETLRHGSSP